VSDVLNVGNDHGTDREGGEMLGLDFVAWIILLFAVLLFAKATVALRLGKIDAGWVFEPVVADRTKEPFFYWFMVCASYFAAVFGVAIVIYGTIFPRH
jgi:hypothetical protein